MLYLSTRISEISIQITEVYKPRPAEILIRIQATSLNPVDWNNQKSGIFLDKCPVILGLDIAGDVEELGEGVAGFEKGDRV